MKDITMKVGSMLEMYNGVSRLAQIKMPPKPAYWVARILTKLKAECTLVEKTRISLVEEFGEEVEGKGYSVAAGTPQYLAFRKRYTELLESEVDLIMPQIEIEALGTIEVEPAILEQIMDLLIETKEV